MLDQRSFRNQDLVLRVSLSVDPECFNIEPYEPFLDALCGTRAYQKDAIRTTLRYLMGRRYNNLGELVEENYRTSEPLQELYGSFNEMKRHVQLPDQLSCSLDLATGTGKSYVLYGIARIMLAEGRVNRALVLCPSRTIEKELTQKFRALSADLELRDSLPDIARVRTPHIINGTESIVDGAICIENFHATLEYVKSSIRDSLVGRGPETLVLNDEVHHVYNRPTSRDAVSQGLKRWKEFLLDPDFGFHYIVGASGTCYIDNEYFADVIYRYSLREAIEQGFAKRIEYVAEDTSVSQNEKIQKIYDNHRENQTRYRRVKPLTILVTRDIATCKSLREVLVRFLVQKEKISLEEAEAKVLIVTSAKAHQANIPLLEEVDQASSPVEWITSVSMLTEGWDVKNVFQIVPHEERAFNSKLLIAQVLGRGLRIPEEYRGERPIVTVFNHDAWSSRIKHLVDEIMEVERRLYCQANPASQYNFSLRHLDYSKAQVVENYEQTTQYEFTKGFVTLISQREHLERETTYEQAVTGETRTKRTIVSYQMYSVDEIAEIIHFRLSSIDMETAGETNYADTYTIDWLKELIRESLRRVGENQDRVSEQNRQRLLAAFGTIHRGAAKRVRYRLHPEMIKLLETRTRSRDSVGFGALHRGDVRIFWCGQSLESSDDETRQHLQEALNDYDLSRNFIEVDNEYLFKTPLNIVLANHEPEYRFIRALVRPNNASVIDAWIKSTDRDFYSIEYAWRKGEHQKRGSFNPDFFIRVEKDILVVEIKGDEQVAEPSVENRGKYKYAKQHFEILNNQQSEQRYLFHFLAPQDFDTFFSFIRERRYHTYVSSLDAALENGSD